MAQRFGPDEVRLRMTHSNSKTPLEPSLPRAKMIRLGRSLEVSQVCFGTEHITHYAPGQGGRLLVDAADLYGVFFVDTDMVYGSHPQVAEALRIGGRSRFVIATKTYAKTEKQAQKDLDRICLELDPDYIDIGLLHRVRPGEMEEHRPALDVLMKAKEKGILRHVGLTTHSPDILRAASLLSEIEILYGTLNRDGSRLDSGTLADMHQALAEAHRLGKGTCVVKTLGRKDLVHDLKGAIEWVLQYHESIDAYCIGFSSLIELREDLTIVNDYFSGNAGIH